jgi:hypothetical protein
MPLNDPFRPPLSVRRHGKGFHHAWATYDAPPSDLYGASYRVASTDGEAKLEIWRIALAVGEPLPTLPLWLLGGLCLPVELEATYERTCREQRILAESA